MPRLLYGGTFDPIHLGHLAIADAVARAFGEPVDLVPAADPPHRSTPGASAWQRARMIELAIDGNPRLRLDRRELLREGRSYTVDTLRELRAQCGPELSLVWVLGEDALRQLGSWRDWRELFALGHLLAVDRPPVGIASPVAPDVAEELRSRQCEPRDLARRPAGGFARLPLDRLRPESASQVRERIARGGDWQALVPPAVAAFIREQALYGTGPGAGV